MKIKKLLAIFMVVLFVALPITQIGGTPVSESESDKETDTQTLKYTTFGENGGSETKALALTETEISETLDIINFLIEKIQENGYTSISQAIDSLQNNFGSNNPLLQLILTIKEIRPIFKRAFIISAGPGSRMNLFMKPKLSMYKPLTFWHYFGESKYQTTGKTIIMDPLPPKAKVLDGWQIGMMRRFIGLHIKIPGSIEDKTQSFFIGYAGKIRAFDLPDIQPMLEQYT
ncbi:MAG: hypothetical protein V5A68_01560 [Candidatus Thermoplasmatota archaeon]